MKYPSVFASVVFVWLVVDVVAIVLGQQLLTYRLYLSAMVFSTIIFLIGFWRNQ